ncbi:MAG: excinuclease ABC subunit UvrB [Clostridia bacterium]|nr:excinuclease ABC subunit UvrB [Clostridia bacterium]
MDFKLVAKYQPTGDQPQAIAALSQGIKDGVKHQVLLGVTGSGKTFTMANVIKNVNKPTLVIAHNKTLAAQLCNEFREFFPENRVEYFVSYYDYYQPEAYLPATDTYIEKDMAINDEIDKLRHAATTSLCERNDTIVVASVSCIYGLGEPQEYFKMGISLRPGMEMNRRDLVTRLVNNQYKRADVDFVRGSFRAHGDIVDIIPSYASNVAVRVQFWGDEIEGIFEIDALTGNKISSLSHIAIFPASHFAVGSERLHEAIEKIRADLAVQKKFFDDHNMVVESHRITQRTNYDLEMLAELGFVKGIENYSRYFDGRQPGEPPYTLLSYFPKDYLVFIDESHITIPQIRGMYNGDRARKKVLVDFGFRLPSAYDNRPLNFTEFNQRLGQCVYVSATPEKYELDLAGKHVVEQIIRPTGLLDPVVIVRNKDHQISDVLSEIRTVAAGKGKILVTTLTKKMAEDLTAFLTENQVRVRYLHSEIDTLERTEILTAFRQDQFDVIVGINLLREGLDLPEVELVAILDADKEGLFRSTRALIQTIGRAARNAKARVILYANSITPSMQAAMDETARRRQIQMQYNEEHHIVPKTVYSSIKNSLYITKKEKGGKTEESLSIEQLTALMNNASENLNFELAIQYRERINALQQKKSGHKTLKKL